MKGRETSLNGSGLGPLCALVVLAQVWNLAEGRCAPGQQGEGTAAVPGNFSELAAAEAREGPPPLAVRPTRPRRSTSRTTVVPGPISGTVLPSTESGLEQEDLFGLGFTAAGAAPPPPPSPPASASFPALPDDATVFNPDTQGAVGPNHLMITLASQVRIQDRAGATLSTISLNGFWGPLGKSNVYDPRVLYDPFGRRWIHTALSLPRGSSPGLLVAVSQTSDPTGNWNRYFVAAGATNTSFPDSPSVGYTKDWITVQANMFDQTNGFFFASDIRVFDKTNLYAGGTARFKQFRDTRAVTEYNAVVPAVHCDATSATNYLVGNWNGNPGDGFGYLRVLSVSGPVGAEVLNDYGTNGLFVASDFSGNPLWDQPWDNFAPTDANFARQAGSTNRIFIGDARVQNVMFRNGQIWCAHHIFLPADAPNRCAVQWWAFTPGATLLQRGRVDDPGGTNFFAYPSIAVNASEDVLLGYSRFSARQFPSANYSFHPAEGGPGSLSTDTVLKAGEAPFSVPDTFGVNHWGDWSATVVDPANDTDFWTIQEYAATPVAGKDRWGTWWGRVSPASRLSLFAAAADSITAGSDLTYSIWVTNQSFRIATGVRLSSTLPAGAAFVGATSSQGGCAVTNGVVTCNFGDVLDSGVVSASIVARMNQAGPATNTVVASAFGPEEAPADNTARVLTAVAAAADLAVLLSGPAGPVLLESNLTYTLTVTNRGPSAAAPVHLTNTLPQGATYVSATSSRGACSQSGGLVTCDLGTMTPALGVNISIVAAPTRGGQLTNQARVASTTLDSDLSNNTAALVTRVNARPTVQTIADRTMNEDSLLGQITFTVGDAETPAANLTVAGSSSDQGVLPNAAIALGIVAGTGGASRSLVLTPPPNAYGTSTVTLTVTDADGTSANTSFVLRVLAVNDAPSISVIPDQTINEDTLLGPLHFTVGDVETAPGNLAVTGASSNPALIPNANILISSGAADRTIRIMPATNQSGRATITVTVSDGLATVNGTFLVTVNASNDPPTLDAISDRTVNEDALTQTVALSGISSGAPDEAQPLSVTALSSNPSVVPHPTVSYAGSGPTGSLTFKPVPNANGTVTINVSVSDGALTTVRPFTVTVLSINDRPSISSVSSREIPPDTATIIPFTIFDVETPPDALALQAVSSNPQVIDANGLRLGGSGTNRTLQLTPLSIRSGTSTVVTITVTDSSNEVTRMSFTITVPQPPIITSPPANQTVTNGATATFNVTATGPAPILYQWKRNGADLAGRTNSSLVLTGVRPTDSGSYTVVVRNSGGSVTSAAATLRVLVVPAITGISRAGATAGISFLSESGLSYTVEYRNSLAVPGWTSLTPVIGTGVRLTVTDPAATAPARFYRVRVQ